MTKIPVLLLVLIRIWILLSACSLTILLSAPIDVVNSFIYSGEAREQVSYNRHLDFSAYDSSAIASSITVKNIGFHLPNSKPIVKQGRRLSDHGRYYFQYEYNEVSNPVGTIAVLLIPPIGVGIGRWYFDRLLTQLAQAHLKQIDSYQFIALDLLASGSASNPIITRDDKTNQTISTVHLPLFTLDDWSNQLVHFMSQYQQSHKNIQEWCIVANGGCAPLALEVVSQCNRSNLNPHNVTIRHVVLSAPPSIQSILVRQSPDMEKLERTYYNILLRWPGKLFWWYALRNRGIFLRRFAERNLFSDPANLGWEWCPNCLQTALLHEQRTKHSTFAFLAGALQRNCQDVFQDLKLQHTSTHNQDSAKLQISLILPRDTKENRAKSWLWQKQRHKATQSARAQSLPQSWVEYLSENHLGGNNRVVDGRRCIAYEDPRGFAEALVSLLSDRRGK